MFYAGYATPDTDVAVFQTENQRDAWVNDFSFFHRVAFCESDLFFILDGFPIDSLRQEADDIDDSIVWLINPANLN